MYFVLFYILGYLILDHLSSSTTLDCEKLTYGRASMRTSALCLGHQLPSTWPYANFSDNRPYRHVLSCSLKEQKYVQYSYLTLLSSSAVMFVLTTQPRVSVSRHYFKILSPFAVVVCLFIFYSYVMPILCCT